MPACTHEFLRDHLLSENSDGQIEEFRIENELSKERVVLVISPSLQDLHLLCGAVILEPIERFQLVPPVRPVPGYQLKTLVVELHL